MDKIIYELRFKFYYYLKKIKEHNDIVLQNLKRTKNLVIIKNIKANISLP